MIWLPHRQAADCARALAKEELVDSELTASEMLVNGQCRNWPSEKLARYAVTLIRQIDLYGFTLPRAVKIPIYDYLGGQHIYYAPDFIRKLCEKHRASLKHIGLCRLVLDSTKGFDMWRILYDIPPIDQMSQGDIERALGLRELAPNAATYSEFSEDPYPFLRGHIVPNKCVSKILSRRRNNATV